MGGGDESQGLDALITIVPPPEVCVETVNWHLRGAENNIVRWTCSFSNFEIIVGATKEVLDSVLKKTPDSPLLLIPKRGIRCLYQTAKVVLVLQPFYFVLQPCGIFR